MFQTLNGPFSELREPILKSNGILKSSDHELFENIFFGYIADVDFCQKPDTNIVYLWVSIPAEGKISTSALSQKK